MIKVLTNNNKYAIIRKKGDRVMEKRIEDLLAIIGGLVIVWCVASGIDMFDNAISCWNFYELLFSLM